MMIGMQDTEQIMRDGLHLILVRDERYAIVSIDPLLIKRITDWGLKVIKELEHVLALQAAEEVAAA